MNEHRLIHFQWGPGVHPRRRHSGVVGWSDTEALRATRRCREARRRRAVRHRHAGNDVLRDPTAALGLPVFAGEVVPHGEVHPALPIRWQLRTRLIRIRSPVDVEPPQRTAGRRQRAPAARARAGVRSERRAHLPLGNALAAEGERGDGDGDAARRRGLQRTARPAAEAAASGQSAIVIERQPIGAPAMLIRGQRNILDEASAADSQLASTTADPPPFGS